MARKKENVAVLLIIYWERVAKAPRGPGPCLRDFIRNLDGIENVSSYRIIVQLPKMKPIVTPTPAPMRAPILQSFGSSLEEL
jgi:hypothetical protein